MLDIGQWQVALLTTLGAVSPMDWALVLAALVLIRASSRLGMWPYALMAMPGTLAHEGAHYLVALLLGARPTFPTLLPQRVAGGWRLGSVAFRAGMFRAVPIALAPLALLPLALCWAVWFMTAATWPMLGVHAWIAAALVSASLPSSADFRIAFPALILIAALLAIVWFASTR